jgi:beta-lactamase superfamily II metal-dependent hydrolase
MYGHPHAEVVKTFVDKDAEIYRTDTDGSIVFSCTKEKISLEYLTEKVA